MLEIRDLHVTIAGNPVLKGINLSIPPGETFILFGPNGSGKNTLLMAIMGFGGYEITRGQIFYKNTEITHAPMYERARLGIGMSFQRPPTIHGLTTRSMVEMCGRHAPQPARPAAVTPEGGLDVEGLARKVNFDRFLDRDINAGFSGGEIKRSELLQLMAQQPDLLLFDEPESGVDLENMALIGETARQLLSGADLSAERQHCPKKTMLRGRKSGLIITHTGYILDYVNADRAQVMYEGKLCCEARPRDILEHIRKYGYQECLRCFANGSDLGQAIETSYRPGQRAHKGERA